MKSVFVIVEILDCGTSLIKVTSTEELAIKYVKEETDGNWIDTVEIV